MVGVVKPLLALPEERWVYPSDYDVRNALKNEHYKISKLLLLDERVNPKNNNNKIVTIIYYILKSLTTSRKLINLLKVLFFLSHLVF